MDTGMMTAPVDLAELAPCQHKRVAQSTRYTRPPKECVDLLRHPVCCWPNQIVETCKSCGAERVQVIAFGAWRAAS